MKSKLLICLLAISLIAGLGWGCAGEPEEQTYKVGTVTCVTGAIPQMGEYCLRGWELAKEDIEKAGMVAPGKVELCVEDGQNEPKLALACLTRLIDVEKVPYVETVGSSVVLACAPICEESHVVLMNTAAKSPLITDAGDYIFSITVNAVAEGNAGVDFIKNTLNVDKCSVLYVNNEYGLTVGEYFIDLYQKEGGTILDSIVYELGATDYRTHITKLKAKNPPVIYLVGHQNEAGYIAKQTVELGLNTQWVAPCGVITPEMFAIGEETCEGWMALEPPFSATAGTPKMLDFARRYNENWGVDPTMYSANSYMAFMLYAMAVQSGATTAPEIKDFLYTVKDLDCVIGKLSIDAKGMATFDMKPWVVKGGALVAYK